MLLGSISEAKRRSRNGNGLTCRKIDLIGSILGETKLLGQNTCHREEVDWIASDIDGRMLKDGISS